MRNKKIGYLHEKYWSSKSYAETMHMLDINSLIQKYTEKAKTIEEPCWYAKGVALYFTYNEDVFVIYPDDINTSPEKFEILQSELVDDLYNAGAYDMFCSGDID